MRICESEKLVHAFIAKNKNHQLSINIKNWFWVFNESLNQYDPTYKVLDKDILLGEHLAEFIFYPFTYERFISYVSKYGFGGFIKYYEKLDQSIAANCFEEKTRALYITVRPILDTYMVYLRRVVSLYFSDSKQQGKRGISPVKRLLNILNDDFHDLLENPEMILRPYPNNEKNQLRFDLELITDSFIGLLNYELYELAKNNIKLVQCKRCKRFFLKNKASDLCDMIFEEGSESCRKKGFSGSEDEIINCIGIVDSLYDRIYFQINGTDSFEDFINYTKGYKTAIKSGDYKKIYTLLKILIGFANESDLNFICYRILQMDYNIPLKGFDRDCFIVTKPVPQTNMSLEDIEDESGIVSVFKNGYVQPKNIFGSCLLFLDFNESMNSSLTLAEYHRIFTRGQQWNENEAHSIADSFLNMCSDASDFKSIEEFLSAKMNQASITKAKNYIKNNLLWMEALDSIEKDIEEQRAKRQIEKKIYNLDLTSLSKNKLKKYRKELNDINWDLLLEKKKRVSEEYEKLFIKNELILKDE